MIERFKTPDGRNFGGEKNLVDLQQKPGAKLQVFLGQ